MIKKLPVLSNSDKEPRTSQQVFVLGNIIFVPHYEHDAYVGPGYGINTIKLFTRDELIKRGAIPQMYPLWGSSGIKRPRLYKEK